jgi:outer membrane lipoprotein-sorting protein
VSPALLDRASQALNGVRTAEGVFSQTDPSGEVSTGRFYISRPGKVRFEYASPEPMTIVSDGVTISIHEPERDAYDAVPLASTPLHMFLRAGVDLRKDGEAVGAEVRGTVAIVTLEDRTGEAEGRLALEFDASTFDLLGWTASDGSGAATRVRLSDVRVNPRLAPSLFVVRDPNERARGRR